MCVEIANPLIKLLKYNAISNEIYSVGHAALLRK